MPSTTSKNVALANVIFQRVLLLGSQQRRLQVNRRDVQNPGLESTT